MYSYKPEYERGAVAVALAVAEITDIWYWDSSLGIYNPWLTEPPTILIGTEAGAQAIVRNLSDEYLDLGLLITAYDPLGNPLGVSIVGPTRLAPGDSLGGHYRVVTERPGIYTITTDIITSPTPPYGKIGPTLSWPVAYVVGELPPLVGHVYDPFVLDVTTGEAFYSLPVEIDWGHEVIVGIHWINDGGETATFTPTFELTDPDGISREIQTFNTVLSPSEHTGGQTGDSVKLDKAGMWKIHATLDAEGTLLDEKTWDAISVAPPPVEYEGTITKKQLEYDSLKVSIPAGAVPFGKRGLVHIWGRNDTSVKQIMGIDWIVKDPYGVAVEHYHDFEFWPFCPPGGEHHFIGGRFDLDKEGTYTIEVKLLMNPDSPVTVDEYAGVLCMVSEAPPVEYKGTITEMKLEYDETQAPIPVSSIPQGASALLRVTGRNDTPDAQRMGISWMVYDPLGGVVNQYAAWEDWPYTGGYKEHEFHKFGGEFTLSEEGKYTTVIWLLMNPDDPVIVDSYDGDLCTVTPEVPPEYELIQDTIYHFAYIYEGDVEVTTATFKTDPFSPSAWMADKFASKLEEEVRARGGRPLEVKVYVDKTPLLWADFRVEVKSTPIGGVGIAVGIPVWLAIILVALAICYVIVVLTLSIKTIVELFKTQPGLEDVKPAWGKEALVLDIQDAEEYWERTPTPVETLEGMSEAELRDILDQIAEEEVPPEVAWLPLVIVGGLGILGVGAVAALAMGRPAK